MPAGRPGGHPTFWQVLGGGGRQALLIHCALARSGAWTGMMEHLGERLTATAFDLPGHGESGDWDGAADIHDLATAVASGLLGAGPADLIGHSFGATVALRLALEAPARVRSLTLIEPVLIAAARGRPEFDRYAAAQARFNARVAGGDAEAAARDFVARWGTGRTWETLPEAQRRYMVARIGLIPASDPALQFDRAGLAAPGRLEALQVPVLLVEGRASPAIVAAIGEVLAARLPDARRVLVAGAGHMVPLTHPADVAAAIARFLDQTAVPAG